MLLKPYTDIEMADTGIDEIPAPIVLVLGAGERCCKFDVQLELRKALLEHGYKYLIRFIAIFIMEAPFYCFQIFR